MHGTEVTIGVKLASTLVNNRRIFSVSNAAQDLKFLVICKREFLEQHHAHSVQYMHDLKRQKIAHNSFGRKHRMAAASASNVSHISLFQNPILS